MSVSSAVEFVGGGEEDLGAVRGHPGVAHAARWCPGRGRPRSGLRSRCACRGGRVRCRAGRCRVSGRGHDPRAVGGDVELGDAVPVRALPLGRWRRSAVVPGAQVAVVDREVRAAGVGAGLEGVFGGEEEVLAVAGEVLGDLAFGLGAGGDAGGQRAATCPGPARRSAAAPGSRFRGPSRSRGCRGWGRRRRGCSSEASASPRTEEKVPAAGFRSEGRPLYSVVQPLAVRVAT